MYVCVCVKDIKVKVELFPYRFIFIPLYLITTHAYIHSIVGDFHFRVLVFIQINSSVLISNSPVSVIKSTVSVFIMPVSVIICSVSIFIIPILVFCGSVSVCFGDKTDPMLCFENKNLSFNNSS